MHETMKREFKSAWDASAKKEVVAFANSEGGALLIGVDDDGNACGLDDPDTTLVQVTNALRDGIRPDLAMFFRTDIVERNGMPVIVVEVSRGTDRPYYLSDKGLKPSGVYVRKGSSSVPACEAEIREMLKESSDGSFDQARSIEQDLTFDEAQRAFDEAGVAWGELPMRTLGIVANDGLYTNLGWLLSDQCTAGIKAAVFEGSTKAVFRTRREFSGSLFKQFREIAEFIDLYNGKASIVRGDFRREDTRDYEPEVIREALLNMMIHRDYSFTDPALISMFDDHMELLNLGGLPKGLTKEDMMMGVSVQRNPRLAQVFYRLGFVEAYGTGVPKIMGFYEGAFVSPRFEVSDNVFKVVLPSQNSEAAKGISASRSHRTDALSYEERALELARHGEGFARADLQKATGVSQSMAGSIVREMKEKGLLRSVGSGRSTRYVLA